MNSETNPFIQSPYIYEIEPTNFCPYTCRMCPRGLNRMKRPVGFMTMDTLNCLIDQFPKGQRLVRLHHFGEAALHPEIILFIEKIREKKLIPILSLNPASLHATLIDKLISSGIEMVCFSLDAFTDELLFKIRGIKRPFSECWQMVEDFIRKSRRSGSFILKIIQMVRLEANREDIEKFFRIKDMYPEDDVHLYISENYGFGDLDLVEKTSPGNSNNIVQNAVPCRSPFTEVSVLWNGDVVLCCYDYDAFNVIGNIRDQPLREIWKGKYIRRMRSAFQEKRTKSIPLCSNCFRAPHQFNREYPFLCTGLREEKEILDIFFKARSSCNLLI